MKRAAAEAKRTGKKRALGWSFISKPDAGCQGDGIQLIRSLRSLEASRAGKPRVLQRYITRPLLLDGYKFDLRLYAVVVSLLPLRVHLCKEGMARVATEPYGAKWDVCGHLTNYSVNKHSRKFTKGASGDNFSSGSKRLMSAVFAHLETAGADVAGTIWPAIVSCVRQTMLALQPSLIDAAETTGYPGAASGACFHIFGFDVMLDRQYGVHLLELNNSPSMGIDDVYDLADDVPPPYAPHGPEAAAARAAERAGLFSSGAEFKTQCTCKEMLGPHQHGISPVDARIKVPMLTEAFRLVLECPVDSELWVPGHHPPPASCWKITTSLRYPPAAHRPGAPASLPVHGFPQVL